MGSGLKDTIDIRGTVGDRYALTSNPFATPQRRSIEGTGGGAEPGIGGGLVRYGRDRSPTAVCIRPASADGNLGLACRPYNTLSEEPLQNLSTGTEILILPQLLGDDKWSLKYCALAGPLRRPKKILIHSCSKCEEHDDNAVKIQKLRRAC